MYRAHNSVPAFISVYVYLEVLHAYPSLSGSILREIYDANPSLLSRSFSFCLPSDAVREGSRGETPHGGGYERPQRPVRQALPIGKVRYSQTDPFTYCALLWRRCNFSGSYKNSPG